MRDRRFRRWFQWKLAIASGLLVMGVLGISGWIYYILAKGVLDEELGRRLLSAARMISLDTDLLSSSVFLPGDEGTSFYRELSMRLAVMANAANVESVYIFDKSGKVLVHSDPKVSIGSKPISLRVGEPILEAVWKGKGVSSPLYKGPGGRYFKSAYFPLKGPGDMIELGIGVEAGVGFLESVRAISKRMILIFLLAALCAMGTSILIARALTSPLAKLAEQARRISDGDLSARAEVSSSDEIGFLSDRFNEMASSLQEKDKKLKERMSLLEQLAFGVAHELRNPLTVIGGYATMLKRSLRGKEREIAERILNEVELLQQFVSRFLDFARPLSLRKMEVSLEDVIKGAIEGCRETASSKGVRFLMESEGGWPRVMGDRAALERAFSNIVTNALEAVGDGGTVRIRAWEEGGWAKVAVSDDGHGIPKDVLGRIFDPFFTTKENGIGLGLCITRRIVEGHGGRIEVESEEGIGTTFTIVLRKEEVMDRDVEDTHRGRQTGDEADAQNGA
jgi:signal transduction histidine kinase